MDSELDAAAHALESRIAAEKSAVDVLSSVRPCTALSGVLVTLEFH